MKPDPTPQEIQEHLPYEPPQIIYEGELTTRAGTDVPPGSPFGVDPAKLFGNVD
jgi:hypothetical protein